MSYIRLYLVPLTPSSAQQILDVDSTSLVLSGGKFQPVQTAPTVTTVPVAQSSTYVPFQNNAAAQSLVNNDSQEYKVFYREPVSTSSYPDTSLQTAVDPSGGLCVCGITCNGTDVMFAQVKIV